MILVCHFLYSHSWIVQTKKIVGEKVYLLPRGIEDAQNYALWLNNYDIAKYLNQILKR